MKYYIIVIGIALKRLVGPYGKWITCTQTIEAPNQGAAIKLSLERVKELNSDVVHSWVCSISEIGS